MSENIVVMGATSAIAQATCRHLVEPGRTRFLLVGRDAERLAQVGADLSTRGACEVIARIADLADIDAHPTLFAAIREGFGDIDILLVAHGNLPDQKAIEGDVPAILRSLATNATSVISLLELAAHAMEKRGSGSIACIGSVAGDRGRQSNYIYGTAKAAVSTYLQGLRNRLHRSGVHVLTVKPGFVDTPMTAAFPKGPLWASADSVGGQIAKAIRARRDVIYTPRFWWLVMLVIRLVPETVFKRLSL